MSVYAKCNKNFYFWISLLFFYSNFAYYYKLLFLNNYHNNYNENHQHGFL